MKIMKWVGIAFAAGLALVALALGTVYFVSESKIGTEYNVPAESMTVTSDSALLDRGRHLASAVSACIGCHGPGLGGKQMIDAPVFATVAASNLTTGRGGVGAKYTEA